MFNYRSLQTNPENRASAEQLKETLSLLDANSIVITANR